MATWRELKKAGVKRCCAVFVGGKQCRRRVAGTGGEGRYFCAKHAPTFERARTETDEMLRRTEGGNR